MYLQLAGALVRTGRRQGVGPAVTAVALLQDKVSNNTISVPNNSMSGGAAAGQGIEYLVVNTEHNENTSQGRG